MSQVLKTPTYIDTSINGLVVQITHNMDGTAYPFLYELSGGHKVFLSLFDPRIAEFKNLDDDTVQITFAAPFAGYLDLVVFDVESPTLTSRITELEKKINDLGAALNGYTPRANWTQMNNYLESRIKDTESKTSDLQVQVNSLEQELDQL